MPIEHTQAGQQLVLGQGLGWERGREYSYDFELATFDQY